PATGLPGRARPALAAAAARLNSSTPGDDPGARAARCAGAPLPNQLTVRPDEFKNRRTSQAENVLVQTAKTRADVTVGLLLLATTGQRPWHARRFRPS